MLWGFELLPPEAGGQDLSDPDFQLGVLIALVVALLVSLPIWWLVLTSDG
jgi:hypothetical protein